MRNPITRRVHIEFISKDTVIITNAYLQKTFHLDKIANTPPVYIDLVRLNIVKDPDGDNERFLASSVSQGNGSYGLDIIALPNYGDGWQRVGIPVMGRFEYWLKGGKNGLGPQIASVVEGTFEVKIIY